MGNALLAGISAAVLLIVGNTLLLLATALYLQRKLKEKQASAVVELEKLLAGEPCQSATLINAIGSQIGAQAGRSAKASLMADLSHAKQGASAIGAEVIEGAIGDQSPNLAGAIAGLGKRGKKGILNNPLVQMAIQGFLSGQGSGAGGSPGSSSSNGGSNPPNYSL